jgi:hypothetical protein
MMNDRVGGFQADFHALSRRARMMEDAAGVLHLDLTLQTVGGAGIL